VPAGRTRSCSKPFFLSGPFSPGAVAYRSPREFSGRPVTEDYSGPTVELGLDAHEVACAMHGETSGLRELRGRSVLSLLPRCQQLAGWQKWILAVMWRFLTISGAAP
jgi:hypothetical protein